MALSTLSWPLVLLLSAFFPPFHGLKFLPGVAPSFPPLCQTLFYAMMKLVTCPTGGVKKRFLIKGTLPLKRGREECDTVFPCSSKNTAPCCPFPLCFLLAWGKAIIGESEIIRLSTPFPLPSSSPTPTPILGSLGPGHALSVALLFR